MKNRLKEIRMREYMIQSKSEFARFLGFDDHKYIWQCTECGHKNSISSSNIYESEDVYRNQN